MGGIAHAKSLCISGDDVNVVMPGKLSWGHIHISARGALNLTFEDGAVEALGRANPISLYQWWTAQGVGLIELYHAFQASGQKWWYETPPCYVNLTSFRLQLCLLACMRLGRTGGNCPTMTAMTDEGKSIRLRFAPLLM